jgi:hypothetical protein
VNVVVGMNAAYIARQNEKQAEKIKEQEAEINDLKEQVNRMNYALAQLLPGYSSTLQPSKGESPAVPAPSPMTERTVVYYEITREQILEGITIAENTLKEKGVDLEDHPFFKKMKDNPEYKECFINDALASIKKEMDKYYQDDIKSDAKVIRLNQNPE